MKSTVQILRSIICLPLTFLYWFGVPTTVLRRAVSVVVFIDKPLLKYLLGGHP